MPTARMHTHPARLTYSVHNAEPRLSPNPDRAPNPHPHPNHAPNHSHSRRPTTYQAPPSWSQDPLNSPTTPCCPCGTRSAWARRCWRGWMIAITRSDRRYRASSRRPQCGTACRHVLTILGLYLPLGLYLVYSACTHYTRPVLTTRHVYLLCTVRERAGVQAG